MMPTTELAEELELRRLRFFIARLDYLRSHMAAGEVAMLDALRDGAGSDYWRHIDQAIDRG